MFQCTKCTRSFPTRNTLYQHNYLKHCEKRKLKSLCKICGKQLSTITCLKIHTRAVHESTKVSCEICDKLFTCKSSLIAHRKEQHASKKSFKCKSCDLIFWKEHQRAKHEKEAHTNTEIVCEFCDSEFMSKKALSKHIKYVHESRDKLKCPICSSEISRAHSLTEHIKSIHDGCTFECDRCCIFFSRKFNIRSHMEMYDSDYEPKPCKECGRLCFTEHSLKFHIKSYHGKNAQCTHCRKEFISVDQMNFHLRTRKTCAVKNCKMSFDCSFLRKTHEETAHEHPCSSCDLKFESSLVL